MLGPADSRRIFISSMGKIHRFPQAFLDRLTPAERRVALLLIEGYSNKEISTALDRAEPTVKHQINGILAACAVPSRARFIAAYYQQLLCPLQEGERREFGT